MKNSLSKLDNTTLYGIPIIVANKQIQNAKTAEAKRRLVYLVRDVMIEDMRRIYNRGYKYNRAGTNSLPENKSLWELVKNFFNEL